MPTRSEDVSPTTPGAESVTAWLGLGANLGDRLAQLRAAVQQLDAHPGVTIIATSPVYASAAHTLDPDASAPDYLNAVVQVRTTLSPRALLARVQQVELDAGRDRSASAARWAPRPLDIDILMVEQQTMASPALTIPHPRLGERRFVLQPWADLAPNLHVPPPFDEPVHVLLARCADTARLRRTPYDLAHPAASAQQVAPMASSSAPDAPPSASDPPPELPDHLNYIVIEGVIGAGKTTLARLMADRFDAKLVLEEFEENPFLERFYDDRARWAFQTQLAFLASRFRQQKELRARDLFHRAVISDYTFDKDRIFAHHNLDGDELHLYETLFSLMEPNTPTPDLVVYLQSTPERLMENIDQRGRPYEEDMDPAYIEALHEAYNYYFFRYTKSPLLIVNAAEIDFVENQQELDELVHYMAAMEHHGTTYVNPLTISSSETTED